jgi:DNA-binding CsgD family transcriptional regulator
MSYVDKNGALVYTISFVTDVTHLTTQTSPTWSVTERLEDGTSIYHIGSELGELKKGSGKPLLTKREKEVIRLSASGFQTREIANQLGISYQTILTYKKNLLKKTRSRNMAEAVSYAINLGYL